MLKKYKQKIVTFGGGTGQFHLLSGLRELNDNCLITAVAGSWDSGGSSGRLRTELGTATGRYQTLSFGFDGG